MTKQVILQIEEELFNRANDILDSECLDIQCIVTPILKRIVKEQTASFVFQSNTNINRTALSSSISHHKSESEKLANAEKMTKNKAMRILIGHGGKICTNVTFASKNKKAYNYWANPSVDILQEDWSLILNDWKNKKLYLFFIPAETIPQETLTVRNDKPHLIDLQIMYDDPTFTDNRSNFSFMPYFIKEVTY